MLIFVIDEIVGKFLNVCWIGMKSFITTEVQLSLAVHHGHCNEMVKWNEMSKFVIWISPYSSMRFFSSAVNIFLGCQSESFSESVICWL